MKEIIKAIIAVAMCFDSETIDKIKEDYRRSFISGNIINKIKEDIESIDVKGLNNLLNDILEADYPIEDKIKAIEQWDDIMTDYVKYMEELCDKTMEGYDNLCKKYYEKENNVYTVFYSSDDNLVFLDKYNIFRNAFTGKNPINIYKGNNPNEAADIVENFIITNPKYYFVDYRKIYKD
jgi:hypothetical protein